MRRGSSTITSPLTNRSRAGGTRVVLPAPGGASITRLGLCPSDWAMSDRIASIGRLGVRFTNLIETRHFILRQIRHRGRWVTRETTGIVLSPIQISNAIDHALIFSEAFVGIGALRVLRISTQVRST